MNRRKLLASAAAGLLVPSLARADAFSSVAPQIAAPGPSNIWRQGIRHSGYPNYGSFTGSTNYRYVQRLNPPTGQDLVDPIVVESNFGITLSEVDGANSGYTIRAAIEYPAGTMTQLYYNGSKDMAVAPGAIAKWDPAGITIPGGSFGRLHRRILVATTSDPVYNVQVGTSTLSGFVEGYAADATATDNTAASGATYSVTGTQPWAVCPLAILGRRQGITGGMATIALIGDSIMTGVGDSLGDQCGFGSRAIGTSRPWIMLSESSMQASHWATVSQRRVRALALSGATHALCNMGANDVGGASTLATIQTNLQLIWNICASHGMQVWQTTITPHTSSTDTWATTTNQTPVAGYGPSSKCQQLNDWIRTLPAPLAGYFECDDAVSTGRNTGIWTPSMVYTTDGFGIHPNPAGHAAMAAAISSVVSNW